MPPASTIAIVRTFLRALRTGDRDLLASIALPHAELGSLLAQGLAWTAVTGDPSPSDLTFLELPGQRQLISVRTGEAELLLVVHATQLGPRLDLRHPIAARQPDDPRRRTARTFYRALLVGDVDTLRLLAFDAAGVDELVPIGKPLPAQLVESATTTLSLVELDLGEAFAVQSGVQFVSERHRELGIVVLSGLTPTGEVPFLLRPRNAEWRVVTLHFEQAAAAARASAAQAHG